MNILITGADGFIARNLISKLEKTEANNLYKFNKNSSLDELDQMVKESDIIYHLAGVNRPKEYIEFYRGNVGLTQMLVNFLEKYNKNIPVIFTSSIQVELDNDYGKSKKKAEDILIEWSIKVNSKILIYRLYNVFGKWCKPNYNSVIATFCYNMIRGLSIDIQDPEKLLRLVYIDDVIEAFARILYLETDDNNKTGFYKIEPYYEYTLSEIINYLGSFYEMRINNITPNFGEEFVKKLYATYTSYMEVDNLSYMLNKKSDDRGWLAEFLKSNYFGQVFVSKTLPGITRGNHWHCTKTEKFLVVSGKALVTLRSIDGTDKIEYVINGEEMKVIDIPVGYTHAIKNIGNIELITLFFANEIFNTEKPDTYYLEV